MLDVLWNCALNRSRYSISTGGQLELLLLVVMLLEMILKLGEADAQELVQFYDRKSQDLIEARPAPWYLMSPLWRCPIKELGVCLEVGSVLTNPMVKHLYAAGRITEFYYICCYITLAPTLVITEAAQERQRATPRVL